LVGGYHSENDKSLKGEHLYIKHTYCGFPIHFAVNKQKNSRYWQLDITCQKNVAVHFVTDLQLQHLTTEVSSYRVWFAANADSWLCGAHKALRFTAQTLPNPT